MAGIWGSAQQNGAGDALRGAANSEVNAALTQEVEAWLNHTGGKARVTADVGIGGSDSRDFGLDYLWPVKIWQHDILFTQMSAHRWNERDILNVGLGWRHTFNPHLMAGGNLFFDQDVTRHHNRMGAGAELWSDGIRASANYYLPLSGWRHSDDSMFNDDPDRYELYERAARGWDLNLETALSQHVALKMGWFQWYGDKVDVNGSRSEASRNPHGLNLGLKWQPVPLVGVSAEQSMISGQRDNFSVGLNFHWEFGRKLSEMLASENAAALPSLMQSRTEFVTRNNNIVLAYKQEEKDRRLYFSPTEKTTQAGVPLLHAVKGGQGGVIRYISSNTTIATVEPGSGLVNPTHRGDVTITATETSPVDPEHVLSSASYHLTVTPGDFAPSVEGVAIKGDMSPGKILEGSYLYKSNEGEDEDPEQTRLRWYDADSGVVLKEGSTTYEVQTRDMARTVIFEVTPVNKKGIAGNSGSATVNGSAKLGALHIGLMTPGEVRPDGSVKFYVQSNGALQLLTEVKNDKEEAVEGLTVYWTSQNALGHLSQHVTHTDPKGQTSVSVEEIMSSGQDQITASLSPLVAGYSGNVTEDNGRHSHMKLNVNFAKANRLTFIQPPEHAMVGAAQSFTVKLTDQDGEDFKTSVDIAWQSNGQPIEQPTHTNDRGEASIILTAPTLVGTDWEVTAAVEGGNPVTVKIPLVADVATAKVSALEVIDNNAAADGTDTTRVRVTVKDAHENPVAGQAVNFRAGEGVILPATATTEKDGTVTVSQTSLKAGEFRVEATTGDNWTQAKSGLVTFTADSSTAKVSALEVIDNNAAADGTDTTRVRVTVKDAHENPVAGQAVSFDAGTGVIIPATAETGKDGTVTVSQTSQKAGEFQVNATIGDNWLHAKSVLVNFVPGKVNRVTFIDEPESVQADGVTHATWQIAMFDSFNNPVPNTAVNWIFPEALATKIDSQSDTMTNNSGVAKLTLQMGTVKAENLVVTAKSENNVEDSSSIALPPVAGSVELTMASTARVDEPVTLTVTAKDKGGVLMPGAVVTFSSNHPDWMVITPESATTGSNGVATAVATIRPEKGFGAMGGYTLTAKVSDSVKDSKTLQLSVGQIDYAKSSLTPVSDTMVVGNQLSMLIAMKDKFGNPVSGLTGRIGAVLADSQGRNNGGLIHTNSGGIVETEKGNYPFNVKGTRADTYTVTPIVDRVELSALKATVKVMAQKPWIAGTPQIGYTLTIGKGSGFSTATVNWKVNGTIYRSIANTTVDNASLELTDATLINQKVSVEIIDSQNSSMRLESDSVTIRGTPSASNVQIKGDPVYGNQISVDYVYQANGGGDESGTQYQWYWSENIYDKSPTPITGATGRTLKTDRGQYGLYLYVSVTPRGSAGGSGAKVFNDGYFRVTDAGTPSVSQLHIENEARVGNTIEASYIFNANGSGEDNSLYQWASWDEFSGRYRDLDGETGKTLYIKEAYGFLKDIRVSVTPRGTLGSQRTGDTAYSAPVNIVK
ncbi:inverse autotransporter beta domain-containing protein [Enterobacter cloacae]|uniref:Ig-like domain-containing protein n=2 Tax=Enterobacter cloacae TaxID=550 RepID=UPI001E4F72BD|nr:inverse autotransporter beta domain-containing protein [Enterobacter cloacae]MCE1397830.1 inverse autotransporter beta domain-containing protein [Enterobacter cloacae]